MNEDTLVSPVDEIWDAIRSGSQATIVDSPPGAGKSTLVREISRRAVGRGLIPVIVQTNAQADDQIAGYLADMTATGDPVRVGRLYSSKFSPPPALVSDHRVQYGTRLNQLAGCDIVVATGSKWATVDGVDFHFGIVDEAYQMRSDALLPIGRLVDQLLLVGDPGQLAPWTEADETAVRGAPLSPLDNAATTVLKAVPGSARFALPTSYRLDGRAAPIVSAAFYENQFDAVTPAEVRAMNFGAVALRSNEQAAVSVAAERGWAYIELPEMHMPANDPGIVDAIVRTIEVLLITGADITDEFGTRRLTPSDIAIGVSHHSQQFAIKEALRPVCARLNVSLDDITVATANTLQGREFAVTIAWHPMSGRQESTPFHVDAGRLCVLLSRHRHACIVVGRAGIRNELEAQLALGPVWLSDPPSGVDALEAQASVLSWLDEVRINVA
jgi:hypothetical protein